MFILITKTPGVRHFLLLLLLGISSLSYTVYGEDAPKKQVDQLFVLDSDPVVTSYPNFLPNGLDSPQPLSEGEVRVVIECALAAQGMKKPSTAGAVTLAECAPDRTADNPSGTGRIDKSTYYILHLVHHIGGEIGNVRDSWYAYYQGWVTPSNPLDHLNDLRLGKHYKEERLYGAQRLSLIYFHYGIPAGPTRKPAEVSIDVLKNWKNPPFSNNPKTREAFADNADFLAGMPGFADSTDFKIVQKECAAEDKRTESTCKTKYEAAIKKTAAQAKKELGASVKNSGFQLLQDDQWAFLESIYQYVLAQYTLFETGKPPESIFTTAEGATLSPPLRSAIVEQGTEGRGSGCGKTPCEQRNFLGIPKDFLPITYSIEVSKKTPDYVSNLEALLKGFGFQSAAIDKLPVGAEARVALSSIKDQMQIKYVTSSITITGLRGSSGSKKQIGKEDFDNEKKYWFDFSIALPLKNPSELQLEGTFPGLTAKPVEKTRIYAVANFFPGPVDTKKVFWRLTPQFLYGMPFTTKPWESHLFAIGIGTTIFQPFAGWTYSKLQNQTPTETSTGLSWKWQFVWGLNLQAKGIAKVIKGTAGAK